MLEALDSYLVVNQVLDDEQQSVADEPHTFNYFERGLSRSRNRAIEHADGDICYLCDEDLEFVPNAGTIVEAAYREHPDADVIVFDTRTPEGHVISARRRWLPLARSRTLLSVRSCMVSFRRASVVESGLRFDERFGLNSLHQTGAENIFLYDGVRKGLKLAYEPRVISIHSASTSGSTFADRRMVAAKGAVFARIFPARYRLYNAMACLRFFPLYRRGYSPLAFYRLLDGGSREYLATR